MTSPMFDRLWDSGTSRRDRLDDLWGDDSTEKPRRPTMAADATSRRRPGSGTSGDFGAATSNLGEQAGFVGRGVAANVLNAAQGIPGMEALEAGVGALGSKFTDKPLSYRESLDALRGETNALPEGIKHAERFIGGGALAKVLPIGPTKTVWQAIKQGGKIGAGLGATDAALDADPVELRERIKNMAVQGGAGAIIGGGAAGGVKAGSKLRELKDTFGRVREAPTLGKEAVARDEAIEGATKWNYGAAELEGELNGGTSPAIQKALEHPRLKPFVDLVRNGEEGAALSDADVVREVYKLASRQRRGLKSFMERNGYDAAKDLEAQRLNGPLKQLKDAAGMGGSEVRTTVLPPMETAQSPRPTTREAIDAHQRRIGQSVTRKEGTTAQQMARAALGRHGAEDVVSPSLRGAPSERVISETVETPPVMPSFAPAVEAKASSEAGRQTFKEGADNARRMMSGKPTPTKRLESQTPEAVAKWASELAPSNAEDALTGVLGAGKEGLSLPAWTPGQTGWGTLTGLAQPASRLNRLRPLINALDQAAGRMPRRPANIDALIRLLSLTNAPLASQP